MDQLFEGNLMGADENTPDAISMLLSSAKTIAVVGIKNRPAEDAFRVPAYMQQAGYRIIPINPKIDSVLGETCYANLSQIDEAIDIVNLFRASDHIADHVDEILALQSKPKAVWMQLGINHGPSAQRLREAGIEVIQDRCIMVDHKRLLGTLE